MKMERAQALARIRQQAVDQASQHLAACLAAETAATLLVRGHAAEIDRQRRSVELAEVEDAAVEAFGTWLRGARQRLAELSAAQDRAGVETARARATLTAARTAAEAIETMLRDLRATAHQEELQAAQREIDDIATAKRRTNVLR